VEQQQQQQQQEFLVSEAALALDIPESTLRLWIRQRKVPVLPPKRGERGIRLTAETVAELRQSTPLAWDGSHLVGGEPANNSNSSNNDSGTDSDIISSISNNSRDSNNSNDNSSRIVELEAELARVRGRLDGAQTACRVHAARRTEAEKIISFLQGQIAERTEAEAQLRVLLGQQGVALLKALERMALPPAEEGTITVEARPVRPWWKRWGRG